MTSNLLLDQTISPRSGVRRIMPRILLLCLLVIGMRIFFWMHAAQARNTNVLRGVQVFTLDGSSFGLEDLLSHRPALVMLVSSDCSHCRAELGYLDLLDQTAVGLTNVIIIADPSNSTADGLREFVHAHPNHTIYIDHTRVREKLSHNHVPALFEVDSAGAIRRTVLGETSSVYLKSMLKEVNQLP